MPDFSDWTDDELRKEIAPWKVTMTDDDPSERATQPNGIVPSAASGGLVWQCGACGNVEPVETEGYDVGDNEPCVHCDGGVAVVLASAASERATQPNGFPTELETSRLSKALREWERAEKAYQDALNERDGWRERFMVLRSRLHGIRDSLTKLDRELGRIIDEK